MECVLNRAEGGLVAELLADWRIQEMQGGGKCLYDQLALCPPRVSEVGARPQTA